MTFETSNCCDMTGTGMLRGPPALRVRWTDPDFRRDPKTPHWCFMCSKDLKPGRPFRRILVVRDEWSAIHPGDWPAAYARAVSSATNPDRYQRIQLEELSIGPDCARRLGLEWSVEG